MLFRSNELQLKYEEELKKLKDKCYLCTITKGKQFNLLKKNDFPYDKIAIIHDLIISKNHFNNLKQEPIMIWKYNIIFQNKEKNCSIKEHSHLHLIRFRDDITEKLKKEFIKNIKENSILIYLDKKYAYLL